MKKGLVALVFIVMCIFWFPKETHEYVLLKVVTQSLAVVTLGIVIWVGYYFIYDAPKKRKKKKYDQNYPISAGRLSIDDMSTGDIILLKDYGEAIYDGKYFFSKKYTVWIKGKDQNQMKEFTEQELLNQTLKVSCEFGLKWERNK